MNIFRVLASGRKKFSEELCSTMLAWLLHPQLEHGLGTSLTRKFLEAVAAEAPPEHQKTISELAERLEPTLRSDGVGQPATFQLILEKGLNTDFIDLVFQIDTWWFAIENKIHNGSVNAVKCQLSAQYRQLNNLLSKMPNQDLDFRKRQKIVSIYLLPSPETLSKDAIQRDLAEYKACPKPSNDFHVVLYWRGESSEHSIRGMLMSLLEEEASGTIHPLSEYLRHTLKAFSAFIYNHFEGYPYEREAVRTGINPKTDAILTLEEIRRGIQNQTTHYVGVAAGLNGLMKLSPEEIQTRKFQTSAQDLSGARNWIPAETFLFVADWLRGGPPPHIEWSGTFAFEPVLKLARAFNEQIFVEVRGGKSKLQALPLADLKVKTFKVDSGTLPDDANWLDGSVFAREVETKSNQESALAEE